MRTTGVENIERRYTAGGASPTQTPGVATKLGNQEDVVGNQSNSTGVGTENFKENISNQRTDAEVWQTLDTIARCDPDEVLMSV